MQTFDTKDDFEYPSDKYADPCGYVKERLVAATGMLRRGCNGPAVAKQLDFAVEAIELWEDYLGRPRVIKAWRL
jgi:hypothetical protein